MSKKKSFSGSTMTLKDFHGGSIPSDFPLPSAPGLSVRPQDRAGAWGAAPRADFGHARSRPGSAGARGGLEERSAGLPFLSHAPAHIGLHFDEDERKPFDTAAGSRHTAPPPPPSLASARPEPPARPVSSPVAGPWGAAAATTRREDPPAAWSSGPVSASRMVQASAVEKVASGRWQSRPPPDVEVIRFHEMENLDRRFGESVRMIDDVSYDFEKERTRDVALPEAKERNPVGLYTDQPIVRSPVYLEPKERNAAQPMSSEGRFGGLQLKHQTPADVPERPKLKLLPRSKPLEPSETWAIDDKQVYQLTQEPVHTMNVHEMDVSVIPPKPGSAVSDPGSRPVERPRLNPKPCSQPLEQSNESSEKERNSVFGGARPRECVLKERGIDPASNLDVTVITNRVIKHDVPKSEPKQDAVVPGAWHGRIENFLPEQRSARDLERKTYPPDLEKVDVQGSSWRNDHRKNTREMIEKPPEPQRQEPDTWRKPVEEPKADTPGLRFGKAASALELAQAFSRPASDNQRNVPGRPQVPFSRLTDTRELYAGRLQRQINGY